MQHQHTPDSLSPEKLQLFLAGLSGLSPEEVRKAKVLYLRNAISEYHAMKSGFAGFGHAQGCFAIVPIFWPILHAQKRMMQSQLQLYRERIENALEVWKTDLEGERFDLGEDEAPGR